MPEGPPRLARYCSRAGGPLYGLTLPPPDNGIMGKGGPKN